MRWFTLIVAIAGFALAFTTKSPGLLGLGLVTGFGGMIGFTFALAAARIAATAQPDAALIVDAQVSALRKQARSQNAGAPMTQLPSNAARDAADASFPE